MDTWRNDNVIVMPDDVTTLFLRNNDVLLASRVRCFAIAIAIIIMTIIIMPS